MPYNPTTWVNDQTPLSAGNMNKIEQGIKAAHDAIDALPNQANTWTLRQTFGAGIQDGDANADVSFLYSLGIPMHSRSLVVTAWSPKGTPTQFQIKDGSTVLATITLTLNAKEKPVKAVAVFNVPGGTVTVDVTQTFENNTKFVSRTRVVTFA